MKKIIFVFALIALFNGCQDDDKVFGPVNAPSNLVVNVVVANDQSGNVTLTATADNAINFHVFFVEGAEPVIITNGEAAEYRYTQSGEYTQTITVIAFGTGGASSSQVVSVDLDVTLVIDPAILTDIAGGPNETKRWVWDSSNAGHFGVGDPAENFPNFFSAAPNQLDPCLYDDVLIFSHDGQNNYSFQLETQDATFINWAEVKRFFPDATPQEFADECRDIDDQLEIDTSFVIVEDFNTGALTLTVMGSTMSYWSGAMEYEITEITADKLVVRGLQDPFDPPGNQLAWYHTFVPEGSGGGGSTECDAATGETGNGNNTTLVWAEEFDFDGAPCDGNWTFDIGNGINGWGNEEEQYYTDRPENISVENGILTITAKREDFAGFEYTSARIKSQDKFEFTYGRVEARAKLPTGGGTWPAMWMLGGDFETNPWPAAGEIDYMEHVGNEQNTIFSSLHFPGNSGGDAVTESIVVPGVSDGFHDYAVDWNASTITFSVDGVVYHTFLNSLSLPFNKDFFLILNVAMGGTFGGSVDPGFDQSTMEIDYIRVYQ